MLTVTTRLDVADEPLLDDLCRRWSACKRYAYNRLLDLRRLQQTPPRRQFENSLKQLFDLNIRYVRDAIEDANKLFTSQQELGNNPCKVIFGSRKLFLKLKRRHLSEGQRQEIKDEYQTSRKINLYSRGEANRLGNVNLRLCGNRLRINIGPKQWVFAAVYSRHKKFALLMASKCYSVRLLKRKGCYYAHFSFQENLPEPVVTKAKGVIGLDLNASPANIAWAEVSGDGNHLTSGVIPTPVLYDCRGSKRIYYIWKHAHEITDLALRKGKALVLENLQNLSGHNRVLSNWCRRQLTEAITLCARRKGIEIIKVHPAYTSMIGCLKYAPLYGLSRHTSAALVIGRRGLGFSEELPKHYEPIRVSQVDTTKVTRRKKELGTPGQDFGRVYKACRKAALTGRPTGPNWSVFKRFVVSGDCGGIPKLAPLLGCGSNPL